MFHVSEGTCLNLSGTVQELITQELVRAGVRDRLRAVAEKIIRAQKENGRPGGAAVAISSQRGLRKVVGMTGFEPATP